MVINIEVVCQTTNIQIKKIALTAAAIFLGGGTGEIEHL